MEHLQKLKVELPYDSATPLLGIYLEVWDKGETRNTDLIKYNNIMKNSSC
jgi:hypothetical protein